MSRSLGPGCDEPCQPGLSAAIPPCGSLEEEHHDIQNSRYQVKEFLWEADDTPLTEDVESGQILHHSAPWYFDTRAYSVNESGCCYSGV